MTIDTVNLTYVPKDDMLLNIVYDPSLINSDVRYNLVHVGGEKYRLQVWYPGRTKRQRWFDKWYSVLVSNGIMII